MKEIKHHTEDRDIQWVLGNLLRIGVIASMAVVLIGAILYMIETSGAKAEYSTFTPAKAEYASILAILRGLMTLKSGALIQFGILLLIFTPIIRIVFSVFSFVLERDYMYVIIGLIVLAIILVSLNGGLAH